MIKQHPHSICHGTWGNPHLHLDDIQSQGTKLEDSEVSPNFLQNQVVSNQSPDQTIYCKYIQVCGRGCLNQEYCGVRTFFDKWGIDYMNNVRGYKC